MGLESREVQVQASEILSQGLTPDALNSPKIRL